MPPVKKITLFIFSYLFLLIVQQEAAAVTPRFSANDLWPSVGDKYYFVTQSSQGLYRYQFAFDVSHHFAWRPIDTQSATGGRSGSTVDAYFAHFLSGAFGITDFWQFSATLPLFSYARVQDPTITPLSGLTNQAQVGDIRLAMKLRAINANTYRWGLALEPWVTLSTKAHNQYLGDSTSNAGFRAIVDYLIAERFRIALNVGEEFRGERVIINNINFRHRFLSNLGLFADLGKGLTASAEVQANSSFNNFFSDKASTPVEFLGGIRWEVQDTGLNIGVGGGSCGVCGAKGDTVRGFLSLSYRHLNKKHRLTQKQDKLLRRIAVGKEIPQKIFFDLGQSTLGESSKETLDILAGVASGIHPNKKLSIEGHTDHLGPERYNKNLSSDRAQSVHEALVNRGADPERMEQKAHGEAAPTADNATQEGRAENRRVEFGVDGV